MTTYIALLRGINVSGQKIIKMAHLKTIFEAMDFQQVKTYIQSGNILFKTETEDASLLEKCIEETLEKEYGYPVTVIIRTQEELKQAIANNPYSSTKLGDNDSLYVSFLKNIPKQEDIESLSVFQNEIDEYAFTPREVFLLCHNSYGKSKFSNNFLEKKLKVAATTRNWTSVNKLIELANS